MDQAISIFTVRPLEKLKTQNFSVLLTDRQ